MNEWHEDRGQLDIASDGCVELDGVHGNIKQICGSTKYLFKCFEKRFTTETEK